MEKLSQICVKKEVGDQKLMVFFLYEDEEQSVRVEEVEAVNFPEVLQHLSLGGSIFIAPKNKPRQNISSRKAGVETNFKALRKPWYFTHI